MSLSLFIDTTLNGASLALLSKEKTWTGFHSERGDADSAICRMLEEGLEQFSKDAKDITSIVVSHGPGSFTGIKVGLSWAYGFQAARQDALLIGMSSLAEGNAELERKHSGEKILLLLPMSRREAFLCWKESEDRYASIVLFSEEAEETIKTLKDREIFLIATDTKVQEWVRSLSSKVHEIQMLDFMKMALQGMIHKAGTLDLSKLKKRIIAPQYLKKTTVEEKLEIGNRHV